VKFDRGIQTGSPARGLTLSVPDVTKHAVRGVMNYSYALDPPQVNGDEFWSYGAIDLRPGADWEPPGKFER